MPGQPGLPSDRLDLRQQLLRIRRFGSLTVSSLALILRQPVTVPDLSLRLAVNLPGLNLRLAVTVPGLSLRLAVNVPGLSLRLAVSIATAIRALTVRAVRACLVGLVAHSASFTPPSGLHNKLVGVKRRLR